MHTDAAIKTLQSIDEHDKRMEEQASMYSCTHGHIAQHAPTMQELAHKSCTCMGHHGTILPGPFNCMVSCPPLQVELHGPSAVEIPEHEVITRRKQFRMKRDRAQEKRTKKDQKDKDKAAKKDGKQEKKGKKAEPKKKAKEEGGKSKGSSKDKVPSKSKGRSSAEKAKERKKVQESGAKPKRQTRKTSTKPKELEVLASEEPEVLDAQALPDAQPEVPATSSEVPEGATTVPEEAPVDDRRGTAPVDSGKLKKLRKMQSSWKEWTPPKEDRESHDGEKTVEKDDGKDDEEKDGDHDKTPAEEPKKRKTKAKKEDEKVEIASKKGRGRKTEKTEKTERKKNKRTSKKEGSEKVGKSKGSKEKAKRATKEDKEGNGKKSKKAEPKKAPKRAPKAKAVYPIDEAAKDLALKTLQECKDSNCCHPSFKTPTTVTGIDLSTYWSRNAVGVKVERRFLQNKKAKGAGKAQVAYFGSRSPCAYASLAIAGLYVSGSQYVAVLGYQGWVQPTKVQRCIIYFWHADACLYTS